MKKHLKLIRLNLSIALFSIMTYYSLDLIYTKIDENRSESKHIKQTLDALVNLELIHPLLDSPLGFPLNNKRSKKNDKNHAQNTFSESLEKNHVRLVSLREHKNQSIPSCKEYTCRLEAELDTDITHFLEEISETHKGYIAIKEVNIQRHANLATSTIKLQSYIAQGEHEKGLDVSQNINPTSSSDNILFSKKESKKVLKKRQEHLLKSGECLQCTGYFYADKNNWTAWINGKKLTPTTSNQLQNLAIKKADADGLHVIWTSKNKNHTILLKNAERYDPYGRKLH